MPIHVLIVDDSAIIRGLMNKAITASPGIKVVGSAANGNMAISLAQELQPDVIILDIEMPVMDGITALPELIRVSPGSKIVMASTLTARNAAISMQALALGATDCLTKPSARNSGEVHEFYRELTHKILSLCGYPIPNAPAASDAPPAPAAPSTAALARVKPADAPVTTRLNVQKLMPGEPLNSAGIQALAIASSTGGPQALMTLLGDLKGHLLHIPIFITQHMPPTFTTILAEHLGKASGRPSLEAQDGMAAEPGCIYIAPGDFHMLAARNASTSRVILRITKDPHENFCRPSADPMLRSLSTLYGSHLALVVLTGMGQDGMEGARHVVGNGGSVIAQDEATSIVYGMPKAVAEQQLCKAVLPLPEIGPFLIHQIERMR